MIGTTKGHVFEGKFLVPEHWEQHNTVIMFGHLPCINRKRFSHKLEYAIPLMLDVRHG
jgi:hypothetical protein